METVKKKSRKREAMLAAPARDYRAPDGGDAV